MIRVQHWKSGVKIDTPRFSTHVTEEGIGVLLTLAESHVLLEKLAKELGYGVVLLPGDGGGHDAG